MTAINGAEIFESTDPTYDAIADAISSFERTEVFASFGSKFDKMLRGEATFTEQETLGMSLFLALNKGN